MGMVLVILLTTAERIDWHLDGRQQGLEHGKQWVFNKWSVFICLLFLFHFLLLRAPCLYSSESGDSVWIVVSTE